MTPRVLMLTTAAALALSGCGESRLNPFIWFRSSPQAEILAPLEIDRTDPRPLVAEITGLAVERTPGGAIIRAAALPPQQGWHHAALVAEGDAADGVLDYSFRAIPPDTPQRVSTVPSRELTAAVFVSEIDLAGIRTIRVLGATNARTARR